MKIVILDALTLGEDADLGGFNALGEVTVFQTTNYDETIERIKDAEVVVTNKVIIDRALIEAAPSIKLICVAATGMNNIDLEAAKEAGVVVKNVAGYSTDSVVQHTFSMLFYLLGKSRYYAEYVQNGSWQESDIFTHIGRPFGEVAGKKWGIIGMGAIGRKVALIATAFGAKVSYYSTSGSNDDQPYDRMDLETLLSTNDIITIHSPLNEATLNLLNRDNLSCLKDEAVVLNLGRGGIINEADLASIIENKPLYVGLDVVEKEPIAKDNPLLKVQNERLYITPHIAWTSIEAREKLIDSIIEHIKQFQTG